MRYPASQKSESRERLVRESGALAKRDGFAASGVDALARAAGMTSGAFYKHFAGKEALFADVVERELASTRALFESLPSREHLLLAVDGYLSLGHVRRPEVGCVLPTLASEIGRASAETRARFERALCELESVLADKLGDPAIASAILALCVGAVTVARAQASDDARRRTLHAARAAVRALLPQNDTTRGRTAEAESTHASG